MCKNGIARGYDGAKATMEIWFNGKKVQADVKVVGNDSKGVDYSDVDITEQEQNGNNRED